MKLLSFFLALLLTSCATQEFTKTTTRPDGKTIVEFERKQVDVAAPYVNVLLQVLKNGAVNHYQDGYRK